MKKNFLSLAIIVSLASCGESHVKKILVYANNNASFNQDTKTITLSKDTAGYVHGTFEYRTGDAVELKVVNGTASNTVNIPEDGYYIVNFKYKDTIIGSNIPFNEVEKATKTLTQDQLKHSIDSIQQLMAGRNAEPGKTYFILPGAKQKITSNSNAIIVEPYHKVTALEVKEGEKPEVYKFYTISELREKVERMISLTK